MGSPLQSIPLIAPGFKGLNTEDAPLAQDTAHAEVAVNVVIDKRGRIAARRGFNLMGAVPAGNIDSMYQFRGMYDESMHFFSCANNAIYLGVAAPVDITPNGYVITANDWHISALDNRVYFFQRDHEPLVYNDDATPGTWTLEPMSAQAGSSGVVADMHGNAVLCAWGRVWTAGSSATPDVVYWSDIEQGHVWDAGTAGLLDMSYAWPNGDDRVVGLAAHGSNLIIFGENQTAIFSGADVVGDAVQSVNFRLADSLDNVGCVDRDTIADTGNDVIWLSRHGLHSLGRVIQNESLPLLNVSRPINTELSRAIDDTILVSGGFEAAYYPDEGYYILRVGLDVYCFDTSKRLEDGAFTVTKWQMPGLVPPDVTFYYSNHEKRLYVGYGNVIAQYSGFTDFGNPISIIYRSAYLTFGDPNSLKFLKKIGATALTQKDVDADITWDYADQFANDGSRSTTFEGQNIPSNGLTTLAPVVSRSQVNTHGSGAVVAVGLRASITDEFSLQQMTAYAKIGRQL